MWFVWRIFRTNTMSRTSSPLDPETHPSDQHPAVIEQHPSTQEEQARVAQAYQNPTPEAAQRMVETLK